MFVLGDLAIFTLFFATFLFYRSEELDLFVDSQQTLNLTLGTINTLILLTSSWLIALAVSAARTGNASRTRRLTVLAMVFGVAFAVVKVIEYADKVDAGYGLGTNNFFMFFFMFTGIHLVHVLVGLVVLLIVSIQIPKDSVPAGSQRFIESAATFWHLVDLLWIVLFSLFYLVR